MIKFKSIEDKQLFVLEIGKGELIPEVKKNSDCKLFSGDRNLKSSGVGDSILIETRFASLTASEITLGEEPGIIFRCMYPRYFFLSRRICAVSRILVIDESAVPEIPEDRNNPSTSRRE